MTYLLFAFQIVSTTLIIVFLQKRNDAEIKRLYDINKDLQIALVSRSARDYAEGKSDLLTLEVLDKPKNQSNNVGKALEAIKAHKKKKEDDSFYHHLNDAPDMFPEPEGNPIID